MLLPKPPLCAGQSSSPKWIGHNLENPLASRCFSSRWPSVLGCPASVKMQLVILIVISAIPSTPPKTPACTSHVLLVFYLPCFAKVAYAKGRPVPDASAKDMQLTSVEKKWDLIKAHLTEEKWPKVAMLMTRGCRFAPLEDAWEGNHLK